MGILHRRFGAAIAGLFALLVCAAAHGQSCVTPPASSDIVAWWSLDETTGGIAADRTGSHPGSYCGDSVAAAGKVRGARQFTGGSNSCVTVANHPDWQFGTRDFTIEMWANFDTQSSGSVGEPGHIMIGCDNGPFNVNKWFFAYGGGQLEVVLGGGGAADFIFLKSFTPDVGRWYHFAVTRHLTVWQLFIDGQPQPAQTGWGDIPPPTAPLTIGQAEGIGQMRGRLDEVAIYRRVLTNAEILSIYDAGSTGRCVAPRVMPDHGGSAGRVTIQVTGSTFEPGSTVRLERTGQPSAPAMESVVATNGAGVEALLDLTGQTTGSWDVVVESPSGHIDRRESGFTIDAGGQASPWVQVVGFGLIRYGREQSYHVVYGNNGAVDAEVVPVIIGGFPAGATIRLGFDVATPDPHIGGMLLDWSQVPMTYISSGQQVLPLMIPRVGAGSTGSLEVFVTIPQGQQPFNLRAWTAPPMYNPLGDQDAVDCFWDVVGQIAPFVFAHPNCQAAAGGFLNLVHQRSLGQGATPWSIVHFLVQTIACAIEVLQPELSAVETLSRVTAEAIFDGVDLGHHCSAAFMHLTDAIIAILPVGSFDPNEKTGTAGAGMSRYVPGGQPLQYEIHFENDPNVATAPVQDLVITDQLNPNLVDLTTLALGPIFFGQTTVTPQQSGSFFTTTVDLRPANNLLVRIVAGLDVNTGLLRWQFNSLDPITMQTPLDPTAGFLPPNTPPALGMPDHHVGEGGVLFTVMPRQSLATGTAVSNIASIIFDTNVPIPTNVWTNTIDNSPPVSSVAALPHLESTAQFMVQWAGQDQGSGIADYTIYVTVDGGPRSVWLANTTATSGIFSTSRCHSYAFTSTARDAAGNTETSHTVSDASTWVQSACAPDFNCSGGLEAQDIFDYLGAWFAQDSRADFNNSGALTEQDIFDFLTAWFVGC